ncbi:hypothetical protein KW787_03825, partial [Candidatus Pacearchaeota archaeon]|nr:hypothetical protein [Candidatus Pacearchaeota archaeon]
DNKIYATYVNIFKPTQSAKSMNVTLEGIIERIHRPYVTINTKRVETTGRISFIEDYKVIKDIYGEVTKGMKVRCTPYVINEVTYYRALKENESTSARKIA